MPLIPRRCDECGRHRTDVTRQDDPVDNGYGPADEPWMRHLCVECAEQRLWDS